MAPPESRAESDSVTLWARRLHQEGKSTAEVMQAIYGVDLPAEAYALDRAYAGGLDLPLVRMVHPWELMGDAARESDEDWSREQEDQAFALWPRFLPLLQLAAEDAIHGNHVIGYDLEELRAGKPTIWGCDGDIPPEGGALVVVGPSLLAVLHEWLADHHRMLDQQLRSPANRGFGSIRDVDVSEVADQLRAIEALQREVAAS